MYELKTDAAFDAAHFLTNYDGKCENLHGHQWKVVAYIGTQTLQDGGQEDSMVVDFCRFKAALRTLVEEFDHMFIVEEGSLAAETIAALESETFKLKMVPWRTTSENFATYFYNELCKLGFPATAVEVYETPKNCAIYRP